MEIAHARAAEVKSENLNQCSCFTDSPHNTTISSNQTLAYLDELCYDNSSRSAHLQIEDSEANNSTFVNSRELTPDVRERTTKKKASSAQQPSMAEIEEFFSVAEKYEARRFAEKYNFDIVKDVPLQGKYRWVRIEQ